MTVIIVVITIIVNVIVIIIFIVFAKYCLQFSFYSSFVAVTIFLVTVFIHICRWWFEYFLFGDLIQWLATVKSF